MTSRSVYTDDFTGEDFDPNTTDHYLMQVEYTERNRVQPGFIQHPVFTHMRMPSLVDAPDKPYWKGEHYIDEKSVRARIKELLRMPNISHLKFEVRDVVYIK